MLTPQTEISHPPKAGPVNLARLKFMAPIVITDATELFSTNRGPSDILIGLCAEAINPDSAEMIVKVVSLSISRTKKR